MKKIILFAMVSLLGVCAIAQQQLPTVSNAYVEMQYCFDTESHNVLTECAPFLWNGTVYNTSGEYSFLTTNARGCDSTAYLTLTIKGQIDSTEFDAEFCSNTVGEYIWDGRRYTTAGDYEHTYSNRIGCDSVVTMHLTAKQCAPDGALPGLFTIANGVQVYFSKGNLQYRATDDGTAGHLKHNVNGGKTNGEFRFAPNQWSYIGADNKNLSETYTGWIDLFGIGTSTYNNQERQMPYNKYESSGYYMYGEYFTKTNYDWGWYNEINDAGSYGTWYTLTSEQWKYLFNTRANHDSKYACGKVNGIAGLIILPDSWTKPAKCSFTALKKDFTTNVYGTGENNNWKEMEAAGAVFLPAAGNRQNTRVTDVGTSGYYWSASYQPGYNNYYLYIYITDNTFEACEHYSSTHYGYSVRLVQTK